MDQLSILRTAEFKKISRHLIGSKITLEIGGGSGFQKTLLNNLSNQVISIDVKPHPDPISDVTIYVGHTIPAENKSIDRIFSSNVLEHIPDITRSLKEMFRVLKDDGLAIHILPTPSWRIWTTILHYPAIPIIVLSNFRNLQSYEELPENTDHNEPESLQTITPPKPRFKLRWLLNILISQRHGERGNRFTEAYYYREKWWIDTFEDNGFEIIETYTTGIYYSGNTLLGKQLSLPARRILSSILGSSTRVFVLKKPTF